MKTYKIGDTLPLNTKLKGTEMVDNPVEYHTFVSFMNFCEKYIVGENGMLVDMRFMPCIKEAEIRNLLVGQNPIFIVHKKTADFVDVLSVSLFSGTKYTYDKPEKCSKLMELFSHELPNISKKMGD